MQKFMMIFILALSALGSFAQADDHPSFAIFPPIQYPAEDATVAGARFSAGWARHKNVYGLDLGGIGNITDGTFVGMSMSGVFNETRGDTYAILTQLAFIWNRNTGKTRVFGTQLTFGANINKDASIYGLQVAGIGNFGGNNIYGMQIGLYNEAKSVYGFQIGLLNKTQNLHGIQIGLWNIHEKGLLKHFPIINVGF